MFRFTILILSALLINNFAIRSAVASDTAKVPSKDVKYTFRSQGSDFFLCDTNEGKILKCNSICSGMTGLKQGTKLEFYDKFKLVEFQGILGPTSCETEKCTEVQK